VAAKYPQSSHAPTALYKRATALEKKGNSTAAKAAYTQLVQAYPRSDEAALAKERLRAMP
jgi:TolA-binding protein